MSRVKWSRKYDAKLRRDGRTPLIFHQKIMTLNFENHRIFERNKKSHIYYSFPIQLDSDLQSLYGQFGSSLLHCKRQFSHVNSTQLG